MNPKEDTGFIYPIAHRIEMVHAPLSTKKNLTPKIWVEENDTSLAHAFLKVIEFTVSVQRLYSRKWGGVTRKIETATTATVNL